MRWTILLLPFYSREIRNKRLKDFSKVSDRPGTRRRVYKSLSCAEYTQLYISPCQKNQGSLLLFNQLEVRRIRQEGSTLLITQSLFYLFQSETQCSSKLLSAFMRKFPGLPFQPVSTPVYHIFAKFP